MRAWSGNSKAIWFPWRSRLLGNNSDAAKGANPLYPPRKRGFRPDRLSVGALERSSFSCSTPRVAAGPCACGTDFPVCHRPTGKSVPQGPTTSATGGGRYTDAMLDSAPPTRDPDEHRDYTSYDRGPTSSDVGARFSLSNRDPTFEKVGHPSGAFYMVRVG